MNAYVEALTGVSPTAVIVLAEVTLILLAALLVQPLIRRFAAARHALLLLALLTVGLCPAIVIIAGYADLPVLIPARDSLTQVWIHHREATAAVTHDARGTPLNSFPAAALLLSVWVAGAAVSIFRTFRCWQTARQIRKDGQPVTDDRIARALDHITTTFRRPVPAVLASERVEVPVVAGCWDPVVLLPASLLTRLDDSELLQVLVHECAHVFRRDMLVEVYQRFLTAILWFHPLVHAANRLLDGAREELCDIHVIRVASPVEYSRTLLAIAESLVPSPDGLLSPTLVRSTTNLENRVAKLLHPKRCVMTNLKSATLAIIAASLIGGVLLLSAVAVPPPLQDQPNNPSLSHTVKLTPQAIDRNGDMITVETVRGPSETLSPGNTYEVSGTYRLVSRDKATLAAWVSANSSRDARRLPIPGESIAVTKGEGHFSLLFRMVPGRPHVSFYPFGGGQSLLSAYF